MSSVGGADRTASETFACEQPSAYYKCYDPAQVRTAYDIQPLISEGHDGSGEVIAIVDAYQNPTMASDLQRFDAELSLPAPPSFTTVAPSGLTPFEPSNPEQVGWSGEIALDVEWAHAIAPGAKIVLALAPNGSEAALAATVRYVVENHLGNVISMSYGESERCGQEQLLNEEEALFQSATEAGVTAVAGAGDWGAAEYTCDGLSFTKGVGFPASDPYVTGVGGTKLLTADSSGAYGSESVWKESRAGEENAWGGGGGFSALYSRPAYQDGIKGIGSMRGVPDVTYGASARHGFLVAWGSSGEAKEWWSFDGTSAGGPQWSAIVAIADQIAGHGLGNINPALYALAGNPVTYANDFHDITKGNNTYRYGTFKIQGYSAKPGWDAASGLGSPIAANLAHDLAAGWLIGKPVAPQAEGAAPLRPLSTPLVVTKGWYPRADRLLLAAREGETLSCRGFA